jgi:hypothetical protein
MKATTHERSQTFRELTYTMRPQNPRGDGTGLRFETGEHGGDYPDNMPQATHRADGPSTCHYGSMGRSWCRKRLVDSAAAAYPQIAVARGGYRRRRSWAMNRHRPHFSTTCRWCSLVGEPRWSNSRVRSRSDRRLPTMGLTLARPQDPS